MAQRKVAAARLSSRGAIRRLCRDKEEGSNFERWRTGVAGGIVGLKKFQILRGSRDNNCISMSCAPG